MNINKKMNSNIILEINRFRELIGLPLILESRVEFISDIFTSLFGKNLDYFASSAAKITNELERGVVNEFDKIASRLKINMSELIRGIQANTLSKETMDEVISSLMKLDNNLFDAIYNRYRNQLLSLDEFDLEIKNLLLNLNSKTDFSKNYTIKEFNDLKNRLKNYLDSEPDLSPNVKKFIEGKLEENLKLISNKLPKDSDTITSNLKLNIGGYKKEFMSMFDRIAQKYGKKWSDVLSPEEVQNTYKGIKILKEFFSNTEFMTRSGKKIKIEEFESVLDNYYGFVDNNGNWSKLNFLDTNWNENIKLFLSQAEKKLPTEKYQKLISDLINKDKNVKSQILEVIQLIENDSALWKNLINNPEQLTIISKTTEVGANAEKLVKDWISGIEGFEVRWFAGAGSPIDRLLGIDIIFQNPSKQMSRANIKSFSGGIRKKINKNSVWGDAYKVWSKYGVYFSKQTNLDYAVLLDSNGNMILFKKQPQLDWKHQVRKEGDQKFVQLKNGRYGYIDVTDDVRVYWK
jgi:hypothetical protein